MCNLMKLCGARMYLSFLIKLFFKVWKTQLQWLHLKIWPIDYGARTKLGPDNSCPLISCPTPKATTKKLKWNTPFQKPFLGITRRNKRTDNPILGDWKVKAPLCRGFLLKVGLNFWQVCTLGQSIILCTGDLRRRKEGCWKLGTWGEKAIWMQRASLSCTGAAAVTHRHVLASELSLLHKYLTSSSLPANQKTKAMTMSSHQNFLSYLLHLPSGANILYSPLLSFLATRFHAYYPSCLAFTAECKHYLCMWSSLFLEYWILKK